MVDRLLRVHIQSQRAFGPWWTLSLIESGSVVARRHDRQAILDSLDMLNAGITARNTSPKPCCKPGPLPIGRSLITRACRQDTLYGHT